MGRRLVYLSSYVAVIGCRWAGAGNQAQARRNPFLHREPLPSSGLSHIIWPIAEGKDATVSGEMVPLQAMLPRSDLCQLNLGQ